MSDAYLFRKARFYLVMVALGVLGWALTSLIGGCGNAAGQLVVPRPLEVDDSLRRACYIYDDADIQALLSNIFAERERGVTRSTHMQLVRDACEISAAEYDDYRECSVCLTAAVDRAYGLR